LRRWLGRLATVYGLAVFSVSASAQSWDDDLRWAIDLSSRAQFLSDSPFSQPGFFNSIGFDFSRTYSKDNRDFVKLNLQFNLWCINNLARRPGFFDGEDDCQLVSKVSTADFAVSGDGRFNLVVGHPEVPFGLEVPVSTSQTLRQLTNGRDLGLKLDWGVGAHGVVGGLHYSTMIGRGSGMKYKRSNDPYLIAGRIGTPTDNESYLGATGMGFSWFYGEVLTRTGAISERWRVAMDGIAYAGRFGFMGQLSLGETDSMHTVNGLAEINLINRSDSAATYLQLRSFNQDFAMGWQDAWSVVAGARMTPNQRWSLSFQLEREISTFGSKPEQTILDLQVRYRR
jgi:hypothetical protein